MNLFIVRHGHSPMQDTDHQRPLSELGRHQARQAAQFIQQHTDTIPYILCSDAVRTHQTARLIADAFGINDCDSRNEFYTAGVGIWCDAIREMANSPSLILVGHNPTISQLSGFLADSDDIYFKPACVSHIRLEIRADGLSLPAQLLANFKPDAKPE
ncbi:MAG: phosphohistidine phosphatase SixA [Proteobacteria bacterium]|nr:phosphohistidine phosphatase SixA [Pseudomonadota bacterium]